MMRHELVDPDTFHEEPGDLSYKNPKKKGNSNVWIYHYKPEIFTYHFGRASSQNTET